MMMSWTSWTSSNRARATWVALMLTMPISAGAAEIEGVEFADEVKAGEVALTLNNVGLLRYMVFIKAYVAALYLGPDVAPDEVLADTPKRLSITYFYSITAEQFSTSTQDAIRANVGDDRYAELGESIEKFTALYRSVEPGDRYELTYLPGVGTELSLNGKPLGRIPGAELGSAVFSIWFGEREIDADLKREVGS